MPRNDTQARIFKHLANPRKWFIANMDGRTPEILIYDAIGSGLWGDDSITPAGFRAALQQVEARHTKMNLRINSPGGVIHDAFAIFNFLKSSPLDITSYVDGIAASCASWIPMATNRIMMPKRSEMMIHEAWGFVCGTADDMRNESTHIDSLQSMIVNTYAEKTGMKPEKITEMMKATTYMTGEDAVEMGFADELCEPSGASACVFDLSLLPNLPRGFEKYQDALKKRASENALRDAEHLSRAEAARRVSMSESNSEMKRMIKENTSRLERIYKEEN